MSITGSAIFGGGGLDTIYPDLPGADGVFLDDATLIAMASSIGCAPD